MRIQNLIFRYSLALSLIVILAIGCKKDDNNVPVLSTTRATDISASSIKSGGNITSDGGSAIIARGVCWSESQLPSISDNKTNDGTGEGNFTSIITGLSANTTYYARAYATNSNGTSYGNQISFLTTIENTLINSDGKTGTLTDVEGNVYKIVKIRDQWWMAENLRTTKYNDNTPIPLITADTAWSSSNSPGYCWYDNDSIGYAKTYGALYNWYSVIEEKFCPIGWHIPTDEEWNILTIFLGENVAGDKLKEAGTTHWRKPNAGATNETGFAALPSGFRYIDGLFHENGYCCFWWSFTKYDANKAWCREVANTESVVYRLANPIKLGFSVRCVKN